MRRLFTLAALLVVLAHAGCSDDDDNPFGPWGGALGAPCNNDRQCFDRCEEGFCTVRCEHDGQCPGGSACIDEHGGVCAPVCGPSGCGPGYRCEATNRRGIDGRISVCRR